VLLAEMTDSSPVVDWHCRRMQSSAFHRKKTMISSHFARRKIPEAPLQVIIFILLLKVISPVI
jgi:hypothetical protein